MIHPAEARDLQQIRVTDPFFTRILSLYENYGGGYDFVGFWTQENDDRVTAAISRFEDKFSLWLTDDSDLEEVAAFIRFQGAGSCLYNAAYELPFDDYLQVIQGKILRYTGDDYISDIEICEPEFKALYALLQSCASEIFIVPPYLQFLSDLTHRKNRQKLHLIATAVDGTLASSVMTVSETNSAAILGAVATRPAYRKRGLSRELVRTLSTRLRREGKEVYVLSASEANTRFYQHSGFTVEAGFKEIFSA